MTIKNLHLILRICRFPKRGKVLQIVVKEKQENDVEKAAAIIPFNTADFLIDHSKHTVFI